MNSFSNYIDKINYVIISTCQITIQWIKNHLLIRQVLIHFSLNFHIVYVWRKSSKIKTSYSPLASVRIPV
jgi:hypothetical protein